MQLGELLENAAEIEALKAAGVPMKAEIDVGAGTMSGGSPRTSSMKTPG